MDISKFYNKIIKEDGFVILDANSNKYVIGKPKKNNPITSGNLKSLINMNIKNIEKIYMTIGCLFLKKFINLRFFTLKYFIVSNTKLSNLNFINSKINTIINLQN